MTNAPYRCWNETRRKEMLAAVLAAVLVTLPATALAQDSKSAPLAMELAKLMDQLKLDSIAAKAPNAADQFVGALYFPGSQLLVVTAKYTVPQLMNEKLAQKNYRDVYIDLNSASVPQSKVFISDLGCNGLKARREDNEPYDTADVAGKNLSFDGDWKRAKISEDEYMKSFQSAEEQYVQMLQALLAELKKTS
jgi:hypothetical protein